MFIDFDTTAAYNRALAALRVAMRNAEVAPQSWIAQVELERARERMDSAARVYGRAAEAEGQRIRECKRRAAAGLVNL